MGAQRQHMGDILVRPDNDKSTSQAVYPAQIEYVTTFTKLEPGDIIVTGTPGGVGLFMDPPTFLADGDVVEVEVTGLGTLTNRMVKG